MEAELRDHQHKFKLHPHKYKQRWKIFRTLFSTLIWPKIEINHMGPELVRGTLELFTMSLSNLQSYHPWNVLVNQLQSTFVDACAMACKLLCSQVCTPPLS